MPHYTNPAFCLQSELYSPPAKVQKSESVKCVPVFQPFLPPKPGPKPLSLVTSKSFGSIELINTTRPTPTVVTSSSPMRGRLQTSSSSGRFALVPIEELSKTEKNRYTVVPARQAKLLSSREALDTSDELQFCSLPVNFSPEEQPKLKNAFSTNFDSKSFFLNDSRYTVFPTDKDEEIVDDNHEIIEIHSGKKKHRYAVVPTEEDPDDIQEQEETSMSTNFQTIARSPSRRRLHHSYASIRDTKSPPRMAKDSTVATPQRPAPPVPISSLTPQKNLATQKLHELLSTPPQKTPQKRIPAPLQPQTSTPLKPHITPQRRLRYEEQQLGHQAADIRTTAVISPRLQAPSFYDAPSSTKSWTNLSFQKVANATATIGAVSLMLILCGMMNSGLSIYMVARVGRSHYLDTGIISGFAAVALGFLGFRSRQCDWLPNRNYISGYILVTVFSLLNCCGLLVLLTLHPIPGTPIHDITTGVVLGLSSLTLLLISLGAISSRWCRAPPPDNRVDVVH
ncbi:uncharacterized protein LOC132260036 [Phlebotomus argentipes]|uniref:uncharacterized protein LOC132260036 n=1 Tax=Phlebotomus argentipes TaxID=94469 RepID=UPI002893176A|nr:uncharacterized protein LOC132260036 [Phlebotomus argentipes]